VGGGKREESREKQILPNLPIPIHVYSYPHRYLQKNLSQAMSAAVRMLQGWLVFLAMFEVAPIYHALSTPPGLSRPNSGFASNLQPLGAERRLWAFMLGLLVCSRLAAAAGDASAEVSLASIAARFLPSDRRAKAQIREIRRCYGTTQPCTLWKHWRSDPSACFSGTSYHWRFKTGAGP
jgi:hypothetical protein